MENKEKGYIALWTCKIHGTRHGTILNTLEKAKRYLISNGFDLEPRIFDEFTKTYIEEKEILENK